LIKKDDELNALRNELLSSLPTKSKGKSNGFVDEKSSTNDDYEQHEEDEDDKIVVYEEPKEFDVEEDNGDVANEEEDDELERLRLEAIKAKRAKQQTNRIYLNPNHISQTNTGPRHFYNGKYQQYRIECDKLMPNDAYEPEPSLPNLHSTFLPLSHNYSYSNNPTGLMSETNLNRNDLRHLLKARHHQRHQNQLVSRHAYQTESQIELLTDADLDESENELIYSKPITEPIHVRKPNVDYEQRNMTSAFRMDKVNLRIEVNNDLHVEPSIRNESQHHHQYGDKNHRSHRNSNHEQPDKYESQRNGKEDYKNEVDNYFEESDEELGEYKPNRLKSVVIVPVLKEPTKNEQRSRRDSFTSKHHVDDSRKKLSNTL